MNTRHPDEGLDYDPRNLPTRAPGYRETQSGFLGDGVMQKYLNRAFLAKAINRAQRLSIESPFCRALNDYIVRQTQVAWDDDHALFWANHPDDGWQVAVWLMPAAEQFEPRGIN